MTELKTGKKDKATIVLIAVKPGPLKDNEDNELPSDDFLADAPSALLDYVVIAPAKDRELDGHANAVDWIRVAYAHLKMIGLTSTAARVLVSAGSATEINGNHDLTNGKLNSFADDVRKHRM